jgi:hypothetical protein
VNPSRRARLAVAAGAQWVAIRLQRDETATSDVVGHVRFPRRVARASFARQWIGTIGNFGFHSPFSGPRSYFNGCADGAYPDRLDAEQVGSQMVFRYTPALAGVGSPKVADSVPAPRDKK